MHLTYKLLANGPGPSEAIIEVTTVDGVEEVIVDKGILNNGVLDVGGALGRRNGNTLVELPRETVSGRTRVWIPESAAKEHAAA